MTRRNLLAAGSASALSLSSAMAQGTGSSRSLLELRKISFRNTPENHRNRYVSFLEKAYAPALKRAGVEAMGFFNNDIGPDKPHVLCLFSYSSGTAMVEVQDRLNADKEYKAAIAEIHGKGRVYERVESSLFRAFATVPKVEIPKGEGSRLFELRVYESDDPVSLGKKIGMFEEGGEIAIFRKYGLQPVFFGEAMVGSRIPNLTYMVAFPNAAERADAWRKFATSPEWDKLKRSPGLSDGEVVSSISNATYTGLPFSPIR
ncbi:MAG: NIPSNAP family protein [Bryobacterales bacterium]|nr:NIPSNAP family protein [Bryobacterales bacterium]